MEDTLRYYFSAMFQGFAAIIALGAMYFLYFFDKVENQKKEIALKLKGFERIEPGSNDSILIHGIVKYVKEEILPKKVNIPQYDSTRELIRKYDTLEETERKIKGYLPRLLKGTVTILIISLTSTFLIGYNLYLNYFLVFVGTIALVLSIKYLLLIKKIILEIILIK